ncbi:MAG TPA: hypothetical protein VGS79_13180 [Puia sp.]|nr:hypothetical protein [Puia sp.]
MKQDRYPYYAAKSFFDFEFESLGPNGRIRKIATFIQINQDIFSFGFGDLDERTGEISDTVISNNGDGPKVLNTVGAIIFDFTAVFREARIYVEGSTPSRTRWYQMNLTAFYEEINNSFMIYGNRNNKWEPFQSGVNYMAFLGQRRPIPLYQ